MNFLLFSILILLTIQCAIAERKWLYANRICPNSTFIHSSGKEVNGYFEVKSFYGAIEYYGIEATKKFISLRPKFEQGYFLKEIKPVTIFHLDMSWLYLDFNQELIYNFSGLEDLLVYYNKRIIMIKQFKIDYDEKTSETKEAFIRFNYYIPISFTDYNSSDHTNCTISDHLPPFYKNL